MRLGFRVEGLGFRERMKWGFPKMRDPFVWGPHNKDHGILGSILGSPFWGGTTKCKKNAKQRTRRGQLCAYLSLARNGGNLSA